MDIGLGARATVALKRVMEDFSSETIPHLIPLVAMIEVRDISHRPHTPLGSEKELCSLVNQVYEIVRLRTHSAQYPNKSLRSIGDMLNISLGKYRFYTNVLETITSHPDIPMADFKTFENRNDADKSDYDKLRRYVTFACSHDTLRPVMCSEPGDVPVVSTTTIPNDACMAVICGKYSRKDFITPITKYTKSDLMFLKPSFPYIDNNVDGHVYRNRKDRLKPSRSNSIDILRDISKETIDKRQFDNS